jgi:hypothetical protein
VDTLAAKRRIEPERLDDLAADDPRARRARRDLRRVNAIMLQPGIMRSLLLRHAEKPPRRLIDLGGGDGTFMLQVAGRLARRWPGVTVAIVDRHPAVSEATAAAFRRLGWSVETFTAEAQPFLDALPQDLACAITTNLVLHHFEPDPLARLLAAASRAAPLFVACEPRRAGLPLVASRMLWAIGCGAVTRYDAPVSVRAGFRAQELSRLWPQPGWALHEHPARLFTHCFVAARDKHDPEKPALGLDPRVEPVFGKDHASAESSR